MGKCVYSGQHEIGWCAVDRPQRTLCPFRMVDSTRTKEDRQLRGSNSRTNFVSGV